MSPDAAIARLAAVQEGNVTSAQLRTAGLSAKAIEVRAARGALIRRHRGVYAVGHVPTSWFSRAYAGWLAHGRRAALSHCACAAALAVLPEPDGPIHLTRPTYGFARTGTVLHQADLTGDVWHRRNLILTSPARLMLDLAATEPPHVVERAYNQAQVLRLLTPAHLVARLTEWRGRRGIGLLQALVKGHGVTHSVLEDMFCALVSRAGLPAPERNQWIEGVYVDAVWRERRVVVELDSRRFHGHDHAFERDRQKGNVLALRGWTVLRFTYERVEREPYAVIAEVVRALA